MKNTEDKKHAKATLIIALVVILLLLAYFLYHHLSEKLVKSTELTNLTINGYQIDQNIDLDEYIINISDVTKVLGKHHTTRLYDYSQYLFKKTYYDRVNDITISFIYIGGDKKSENYGRITHILYE